MDALSTREISSLPDYVLVCEKSRSVTSILSDALEDSKGIEIIQANSIRATIEAMNAYRPHLIIIGNSIENDSNQELLNHIKRSPLSYRVPILALPKNRVLSKGNNNDITDYINLLEPPKVLIQKIHNILDTYRYFFQESEGIEWLRGVKVIVAEDSDTFINLYKYTLETLGINAKFFKNGRLAWDYLTACKTPPDLIISDIIMPEMSGMELVRHIRSSRKFDNIPIIVSSAVTELDQLNATFELGANDYFTKPFQSDIFILRLKAHLKTHNLMLAQQKLQEDLSLSNQHLELMVTEQQITNNVLRDTLDQLKETQEKLIESEKMAALGGLVTGIAHEINTPLGIGITGISHIRGLLHEIVQQNYSHTLTSNQFNDFCLDSQKDIEIVQKNLQHAAKLITNFKMVSVTQSSGIMQRFNLKECLQECLTSIEANLPQHQHKISLHCADHFLVNSYPDAFHTILNNLINNSIIHGFINMQQGKIGIHVSLEQNQLTIEYHDNGLGMNNNTQEHIFDPFFTTRRGQGSIGLGSHIIYNLVVQRLNGDIHCSSNLGKGSTFVLELPIERLQ